MMSTTIDTAREIYVTGLRNQYAIENQAIESCSRLVEVVSTGNCGALDAQDVAAQTAAGHRLDGEEGIAVQLHQGADGVPCLPCRDDRRRPGL